MVIYTYHISVYVVSSVLQTWAPYSFTDISVHAKIYNIVKEITFF